MEEREHVGTVYVTPRGRVEAHGSFISEGGIWAAGTRVWYAFARDFAGMTGEEVFSHLFPGLSCEVSHEYDGTWLRAYAIGGVS